MIIAANKLIGQKFNTQDGHEFQCSDVEIKSPELTLQNLVLDEVNPYNEYESSISVTTILDTSELLDEKDVGLKIGMPSILSKQRSKPSLLSKLHKAYSHFKLVFRRRFNFSANTPPPEQENAKDSKTINSLSNLVGYELILENGSVGKIKDFMVETRNWTITHIVAETLSRKSGGTRLVPIPIKPLSFYPLRESASI